MGEVREKTVSSFPVIDGWVQSFDTLEFEFDKNHPKHPEFFSKENWSLLINHQLE